MEFLMLCILAVALYLLWRKPEKEKWVFSLIVCVAVLDFFMHLVASFNQILPVGPW